MQPIPEPELLDPDRITSDDREDMTELEHRSRAQQLDAALHASCEYATELWQHLTAARQYLYDSLPSDPRAPGTNPHVGAAPTGPDDEQGWQRWIDTYATVGSILAGPHGDSGFSLEEARRTARDRRQAPNLKVLAGTHVGRDDSSPVSPAAGAGGAQVASSLRAAGLGVLVVLALRGLRPRPGR